MPNLSDDVDGTEELGDSAPDPATPAGRRTLLTALQDDPVLGPVATEALAAMDDRVRWAAHVEATAPSDEPDFTNPEFLDSLREAEVAKRVFANAQVIRSEQELMRKAGFSQDDIERAVEGLRAAQAHLDEYEGGSDPLASSAAYIEHQVSVQQAERAFQLARDEKANRAYGWDAEVEEAQALYDQTIDGILEEAGV